MRLVSVVPFLNMFFFSEKGATGMKVWGLAWDYVLGCSVYQQFGAAERKFRVDRKRIREWIQNERKIHKIKLVQNIEVVLQRK